MDERALKLVEQFGMVFEAQGVARSAGLVLGWLMLSPGPQSLDEIADGLQLSKASISLHTRLLEQLNLIQRIGMRGDRRVYYRVAENMWSEIMEGGRRKLQMFKTLAEEGEQISPDPAVRQRFAEMRDTMSFLIMGYDELLKKYRQQKGR